jgi:hypothetical protein
MGLIFLGFIALLDPSGFATAIAVVVPTLFMIGAFFYAKITLFILAIVTVIVRMHLESLAEQQIEIVHYDWVIMMANAADVVMICALLVSMFRGYLLPGTVPSCYQVLIKR